MEPLTGLELLLLLGWTVSMCVAVLEWDTNCKLRAALRRERRRRLAR